MHKILTAINPCRDMDIRCSRCGKCQKACAFLQENGMPGDIGRINCDPEPTRWPDPFHCSLCGLCGAVCPEGLRPDEFFLFLRQERVSAGMVDLNPYSPVLNYEKLGGSNLLSYFNLPTGGDTVLFPGCALPSTRATTVRKLFQALQEIVPDLGVALGCCFKPSHDLGRADFFDKHFGRLRDSLVSAGVKRVITTCPNCQKVFSRFGGDVAVTTAYEMLAECGYEPLRQCEGQAVIHDACPQRHDAGVQDAVRYLGVQSGLVVLSMEMERKHTRCCGEGGMVKFVRPELAGYWTGQRIGAAKGQRVVTSCAGCVGFLGQETEVDHILDLIFDSKPRFALRSPLTYVSRFLLKRWFKRRLD